MTQLQLDGNKLFYHMNELNKWNEGELISPLYISFSVTNVCNHKCHFCVYDDYTPARKDMSFSEFKKILDEILLFGQLKAVFFSGEGEPMLNKDLYKMIRYTKSQGVDVALNTNFSLYNNKFSSDLLDNLSWIRISLDAGSSSSYVKNHGVSKKCYEKTISNIVDLVKIKKKTNSLTTIGVQIIELEQNYSEVIEVVKYLSSKKVDYVTLKPYLDKKGELSINYLKHLSKVIPKYKIESSNLSNDDFTFVVREGFEKLNSPRGYEKCYSHVFSAEITSVGDLYVCGPRFGNKDFKYGNLLENSFKEIWLSDRSKKMRKWLDTSFSPDSCMKNCRNNSINETLWTLKNPPDHVNFL